MPSYYAIIPASVRYNTKLIAHAKLLYGEITALCNEKGFCWATNSYFAELYGVSNRSITSWITSLIDCGYIRSEVKYRVGTKEIESRKISLVPMEENFHTPIEEKFQPYGRKLLHPMEENFRENTTVNNTINNTDGDLLFKSDKFKQSWQEWVKYRKERRLPKYTETGLKKTFKDLATLCGGDEDTAIQIIDQSISKCWQGLFALKSAPVGKVNGSYHQQVEDAKRSYKLIQE